MGVVYHVLMPLPFVASVARKSLGTCCSIFKLTHVDVT